MRVTEDGCGFQEWHRYSQSVFDMMTLQGMNNPKGDPDAGRSQDILCILHGVGKLHHVHAIESGGVEFDGIETLSHVHSTLQ